MEFTAGSCIRFGWETFKKRPWFFIGVMLLVSIAYGVSAGLSAALNHGGSGLGSIVNIFVGTFIGMGVTAFYLKAHDAPLSVESSDLWYPQPFLKYLAAALLSTIVIIFGLILLIVPGIIFSLMFFFTVYLVIDKDLGPVEAMKESARMTKGHRWALLWLAILTALIMLLGLVCLILGIFVAMPVTSLAIVHAYRMLQHKAAYAPVSVSV